MVKFSGASFDKAAGKDITVIGLGLSHENLDKLREGQSIMINGKELGFDNLKFYIFARETEEKMAKDLFHLVGPDTKVTDKL